MGYTALVGFRHAVRGELVWVSRDVVWMAPLAQLALFLPLALLLALATALLRPAIARAVVVGTFAFLATFAVLLPIGQVARWASALLALGVATQSVRLYARAPERWRRRLGRSAATMAVLVVILGVGQRSWLELRRRAALTRLPAAAAGAPNVLLVIWDTVRGANLSLYGYPRPTTPGLERRAAEGTVFDWAIATTSWTLHSHGSLFTGLPASQLDGDWRHPVRTAARTLAEILGDHGYRTAGFAANLNYTSYESGLTRGFVDYQDYYLSAEQVLLHSPFFQTGLVQDVIDDHSRSGVHRALRRFNLNAKRLPGNDYLPGSAITDAFLAWQRRSAGRPFFAFLNFMDAHDPYYAPAPFRAPFRDSALTTGRAADSTRKVGDYDAAIAYLDAELDRLLTELQRRGLLDQTIVVVTSDHGELFGEHGLRQHANGLYRDLLRVPLLIRYPPRVPGGARVESVVSLRDLPATILDLARVVDAKGLPGISLAGAWSDSGSWRGSPVTALLIRADEKTSRNPNARGPLEAALDDRYHYIRDQFGKQELFAYRSDGVEEVNLVGTPGAEEAIRRLAAVLDRAATRP